MEQAEKSLEFKQGQEQSLPREETSQHSWDTMQGTEEDFFSSRKKISSKITSAPAKQNLKVKDSKNQTISSLPISMNTV